MEQEPTGVAGDYIDRLRIEMLASKHAVALGDGDTAMVLVPLGVLSKDPLARKIDMSDFGFYRRASTAPEADGLVSIIHDRIGSRFPNSSLATRLMDAIEKRARRRRAAEASAPMRRRG